MNAAKRYRHQHQLGVGLVEIMIAMAISLVLLSGVVQIYISSKQTYNMTDNISRMQENARFAMDMLAKDIRMGGFIPCLRPDNLVNTINNAPASVMLDFFNTPLQGFDGGASAFPITDFPVVGTGAGERIAGADAIALLSGGSETYTVNTHNAASAEFSVTNIHSLQSGDFALVCDGISAAVFQVTNANASNNVIVHNTGSGSPGNCTSNLGGNGDCTNMAAISAYTFDNNAQVVKFKSVAYFVGVSSADSTTNSLYRRMLMPGGAFVTEELLEGIENMQILYGINSNYAAAFALDPDTADDGTAERYVTADAVPALGGWRFVVSVRIGLLVHTPEEVNNEVDNRTYNVVGESIGTSSAVMHSADKRIRYVFTSTIKLRNRGV